MRPLQAVAILLFVLSAAVPATSCQCGYKLGAAEALGDADAVVAGVVDHLETSSVKNEHGQTFQVQEGMLSVRRWWKGPKLVKLSLSQNSDCSLRIAEGTVYLLFLRRVDGGRYEATVCSPSKRWRDAKKELEAIGSGERIARDEPAQPAHPAAGR